MRRGTEKIIVKETIREVDLVEFAAFLLKRMKVVVAAAFLGMLAATFCAYVLMEPVYEATAQLYVPHAGDSAPSLSQMQSAAYIAENCGRALQTWEVSQQVVDNLQLSCDAFELKNALKVSVPDETSVILLTVTSARPDQAARIANEFAEVGRKHVAEKLKMQMPEILSAAVEPQSPVGPRKLLIFLAGTAAGIIVAVWALFVIYSRDDRVWNEEDIFECVGDYPMAVVTIANVSGKRKRRGS